jgi:4-alpha-glucanotransferase
MRKRSSGILLHITSLPSRFGIGDLGPEAFAFADKLAAANQSYWQVLPLGPTEPAHGNSPYTGISAFAANTLLISPDKLVEEGYLTKSDLDDVPAFSDDCVDYPAVMSYKNDVFDKAWTRVKKAKKKQQEFDRFCAENAWWLDDYTLFVSLKAHFGGSVWVDWPEEYRWRRPEALQAAQEQFSDRIGREKFLQFLVFRQWNALKSYCNEKGIQMVGDLPIYVNYDSVDVWTHRDIFKLDDHGRPSFVSGVPPDYFSETGQLWGNPVYNWPKLKQGGYFWWLRRVSHVLAMFNVIRIDHFRGLVAYWEIPSHEKSAINGHWEQVPSTDFFNRMLRQFAFLPIIVEDLGVITPDVREIIHNYHFPGMKVVLFAFGEDNPHHIYLPHMYQENYVAYTGTHDTNTVRGWFDKEATPEQKNRLFAYAGRDLSSEEVPWEMVRLIMMSHAWLVMVPLQDILGLGDEARMNRPSTTTGNWRWRLRPSGITPPTVQRLAELTRIYGRA